MPVDGAKQQPVARPRRLSRRALLTGAAAIGACAAGGAAYATLVEPTWLERTETLVALPRMPQGRELRILQLTDFHYSWCVSLGMIRRAIEHGIDASPELICLTGDFISTGDDRDLDAYADVLSLLPRVAPTFAVLGNHDGGSWAALSSGHSDTKAVEACLVRAGVRLLANERVAASVGGLEVELCGLSDLWNHDCDVARTFAGAGRSSAATLLLAHNPDTKDLVVDRRWDVMLSGHTHGGQVVLPLVGAPIVPVRDKRFIRGLYRWRERWLYVSRGIGNLRSIRFGCRPEVTVLRLCSA